MEARLLSLARGVHPRPPLSLRGELWADVATDRSRRIEAIKIKKSLSLTHDVLAHETTTSNLVNAGCASGSIYNCHRKSGRQNPKKLSPSTIKLPPAISSIACCLGRFGAMRASVTPAIRQIKLRMNTVDASASSLDA